MSRSCTFSYVQSAGSSIHLVSDQIQSPRLFCLTCRAICTVSSVIALPDWPSAQYFCAAAVHPCGVMLTPPLPLLLRERLAGVTESLVIITVFGLSRVPDTPALSPNPRPTLMRWIQRARPDLLICQETAADLESQSLVPRLQGSLDFYGPLIDMHDAFLELACTQQPRLPPSKERAPQGAAEGRPDAAQAHGTEESQPAEGAGAARQLTVPLPGGHQSLSAAGRGVRLDQRAGGDPCAVQTASSGKRGGGPAEATSVPQGRQSAQLPRGEAQLPADVASQVYRFEKGMMGPYINLTLSLSGIQAVQSLNLPGWKALLSSHGLAEEPIPATLQGPLHQLLHGLPRELSFHLEGGAVAVCWKGQPLYLTSLWTSNMLALH